MTATQAAFTTTAHIDLNGNWAVAPGDLRQIVGNTGNVNGVRLTMNAPIVPNRPHFIQSTFLSGGGAETLRQRFGGAGVSPAASALTTENRPIFQWHQAPEVTGAYTFVELKPDNDAYAQQITSVAAYDLGSSDPATVACDVVLCLGDSNMSNAVSDLVSLNNLETPFDGRVWYMPSLRAAPTFANTMSARHIPQPAFEPVQSAAGAFLMSPLMAFGARFAPWSAARGRPLLLFSLGDSGSGLNNTQAGAKLRPCRPPDQECGTKWWP